VNHESADLNLSKVKKASKRRQLTERFSHLKKKEIAKESISAYGRLRLEVIAKERKEHSLSPVWGC
jgi:hypothetical protein